MLTERQVTDLSAIAASYDKALDLVEGWCFDFVRAKGFQSAENVTLLAEGHFTFQAQWYGPWQSENTEFHSLPFSALLRDPVEYALELLQKEREAAAAKAAREAKEKEAADRRLYEALKARFE